MKKSIASISLLIYLAFSCGLVINSHYCMKRLVSVHLFEAKADKCGKCGMEMHNSKGCCKDEVKVFKLGQDQNKIPVTDYIINAPEAPVAFTSAFLVTPYYNADEQRHFLNHSPPLLSAQDTYLQINVFRI